MAKKKKSNLRSILVPVLILASLSGLVYLITSRIYQPKFVRYPAFGIDIPVSYSMHGIDVSRHQHIIDWSAVKDMEVKDIRMGFSFIKATEGLGRVDDQFRRNWFKAKETGLPRGAYHFFISSKSGKAQAQNFIETVDLSRGDMPPVLDVETTNGANISDLRQRVKDFLVMAEQHYKVKPIIYTNVDFYDSFLSGGMFDNYPLWVAHYFVQDKPRIKRKWLFWQHNDRGHVNGIDNFVDFNVFNGDSSDFKKILIK